MSSQISLQKEQSAKKRPRPSSQMESQPSKKQKLSQDQHSIPPTSQIIEKQDERASHHSDSEGEGDSKVVWKTLEHHAMTFPAPYTKLPSKIKLKVKSTKEKLDLSDEAEEMATWWAECELTEFGEKEKVRENFWGTFKEKIGTDVSINSGANSCS